MEKWWFDSMVFSGKLEYRCGLSNSTNSLSGPIENSNVSEDPIISDMDKDILGWSENSSYNNVYHLVDVRYIQNFLSDDTFLVRDSYSKYFDIENKFFEIETDHSFLNVPNSYQNNVSKSDDSHYDRYVYDPKYSWNNHINSCVNNYLHFQICIDSYILSSNENYNERYICSYIYSKSRNSSESHNSSTSLRTSANDLTIRKSSKRNSLNDLDVTQKYQH